MYDHFQPILTLAEQHLSAKFTHPIRLEPTAKLNSQHIVLRCRVHAESVTPAFVILKQVNDESTAQFSPRPLFLNEWGQPGIPVRPDL